MLEVDYVLGLGSNLGSRHANIEAGLALLQARSDARVLARSPLYDSAPLGPPQPRYLNGAARIATTLAPLALLDRLLAIEAELGRERRERWSARTLDLDVLWAAAAFADARLSLPHPRLRKRWFALLPLLDVAPELASEYAGPLARSGAPAPAVARVASPRVQQCDTQAGFSVEAHALDLADATAAALGACGRALRGTAACGRNELLVLRGTSAGGGELEALAVALREAARGFVFEHAAVLSLDGAGYDARLLGSRLPREHMRPIAGVSMQSLGVAHVRLDVAFSD